MRIRVWSRHPRGSELDWANSCGCEYLEHTNGFQWWLEGGMLGYVGEGDAVKEPRISTSPQRVVHINSGPSACGTLWLWLGLHSRGGSGKIDQEAARRATSSPVLFTQSPIWTEVTGSHQHTNSSDDLEIISLSSEIENVFSLYKMCRWCWSKPTKGLTWRKWPTSPAKRKRVPHRTTDS